MDFFYFFTFIFWIWQREPTNSIFDNSTDRDRQSQNTKCYKSPTGNYSLPAIPGDGILKTNPVVIV